MLESMGIVRINRHFCKTRVGNIAWIQQYGCNQKYGLQAWLEALDVYNLFAPENVFFLFEGFSSSTLKLYEMWGIAHHKMGHAIQFIMPCGTKSAVDTE